MGDLILQCGFAESGFIFGHIVYGMKPEKKQPNRMDMPKDNGCRKSTDTTSIDEPCRRQLVILLRYQKKQPCVAADYKR